MPAQVPHSRMPLVHASSANPAIAQRFGLARPRYQGITGIVGTLQAALDHLDVPAISMQVGVPYYAAGAQNWKAAAALLRNLEHVTGIPTGHGLLQERVTEWEQLVDDAVAENPEASGYLPAARSRVRPSGHRAAPVVRRPRGGVRALPARARRPPELTRPPGASSPLWCALASWSRALVAGRRHPRARRSRRVQRRRAAVRPQPRRGRVRDHAQLDGVDREPASCRPTNARSMRAQLDHGIRGLPDRRVLRHAAARAGLHRPVGPARARPPSSPRRRARGPAAPPPAGRAAGGHAVRRLPLPRVLRARRRAHARRDAGGARVPRHAPPRGAGDGRSRTTCRPTRSSTVLRDAGLESELVTVDPTAPLPTLEQMIDAGTRLQVSLENGARAPTLPNAFTGLVEETPFTFLRPRDLERPSSCTTNRGHRRRAGVPVQPLGHPRRTGDRDAGEHVDPARATRRVRGRARPRAHPGGRRLRRTGRPARAWSNDSTADARYRPPVGRSTRCRR